VSVPNGVDVIPVPTRFRVRALATLLAATVAAGVVGATAVAMPRSAGPIGFTVEYPLSSGSPELGPVQLTTTPDGAVWFSAYALGAIGRLQLPNTLNQYSLPSPNARPSSITVGPDGNIWFAETAYDQIGRVSLSSACYGQITEFTIPSAQGGGISGLASDGHQHLWFTAAGGDIAGSVNVADPNLPGPCVNAGQTTVVPLDLPTELTSYPLRAGSGPNGVAVDAAGNVWIAESGSSKVARLDPSISNTSVNFEYLTEWPTPTAQSNVLDIAAGSGNRVWFTESDVNRIGMLPASAGATATISEFPIPTADSGPAGITAGPDGAMWFAESTVPSGAIGRISPNGDIRQFATPAVGGALIGDVATASDGGLWYTNYLVDSVGSLSTGLHPARTAPHPAAPRVGAWACVSAVWGTTPVSATSTWVRANKSLAGASVRLSTADVGHRFVCRSTAKLPGLLQTFVSSTAVQISALLSKPSYVGARGKTITLDLKSDAARTVNVQIANSATGLAHKSVTVRVGKGTTRVHLLLSLPKSTLKAGRYAVRITTTSGTVLTVVPLTVK
jgi:virginiamycin B lyase